ncbi:Chitinase A [Hibiscus syriacus]|uniref:Chitinase A n=1 Tax=Hibiscus syriacus TaxID=106335 RepID=A0A6A2WGL8_HIBSY|nr:Chitinase A [Hibiscus syriacus]
MMHHPPSFIANQVRRTSGRFQGVLNIGITVLDTADVPDMAGVSAIGFRDLIRESKNSRKLRGMKKSKSTLPGEKLWRECDDQSEDGRSKTTSSSTALREWNGLVREVEKAKHLKASSEDGRLLCGLGSSKTGCLSPFI